MCRATTRLARDAMACWSPERHWLFHGRVRDAVYTVLLVRNRLEALAEAAGTPTLGCNISSFLAHALACGGVGFKMWSSMHMLYKVVAGV